MEGRRRMEDGRETRRRTAPHHSASASASARASSSAPASASASASAPTNRLLFTVITLLALLPFTSATDYTPLVDEGVPVSGYAPALNSAYFSIAVPDPFPDKATAITINVTPLGDGDPDLYGDWSGDPPPNSTSRYRSLNFGEDTIVVPKSDIPESGDRTLYLAVKATWRPSNFTIVYQIDKAIELRDGQGQVAFVHGDGHAYFTFTAAERESIQVSATGQTRVYIGTDDPPVPPPNAGANTKWNSDFSGGSVWVPKDDERWPTGPTDPNKFYIVVVGRQDTFFVVTATLNGTATRLINGQPIQGDLLSKQNGYYQFQVSGPGCLLEFTVSIISGDPDLYVSLEETRPNPSTCRHAACNSSSSWRGADQVSIDPAAVDVYYVGVHAFTACSYTIVAQTVCPGNSFLSNATRLDEGVSQHGALPDRSYRYYSFKAPPEPVDVTISVNNLAGDADMFVRNDHEPPTRINAFWSSSSRGSDTLTIPTTDSRVCPPSDDPSREPCYYSIMVYAYGDSEYYITAMTNASQVVLNEGKSTTGHVRGGHSQFYVISVYVREWEKLPLVVSVTDLGSGNPDLFMSRTTEFPSATDNQWSATRLHDDAINIHPTDANYCVGQCTYYVAVVAETTTTYSIVFHLDTPTTLNDGVPQQDTVPAAAYHYFTLRLSEGYKRVEFSLVVRDGFANIYVGTNVTNLPRAEDADSYNIMMPWYTGSSQLIGIEENDPNNGCRLTSTFPRYCIYTIGVQGFTNCSYVLTGSTGPAQLVSGVATQGTVEHNEMAYYKFRVSSSGMSLGITVTTLSGDPDLYVSDHALPLKEDPNTWNWTARYFGGDHVHIDVVEPGWYYIGVYGFGEGSCSFTVVASLVDPDVPLSDIIQLNDGDLQNGVGTAGQSLYYSISLIQPYEQLFIAASKISGDPDIYVRWDAGDPTKLPDGTDPTTYTWSANNAGDDTITINNPDAGTYTIAVYGARDTEYLISAATGHAFQRLSDGVARRGAVSTGAYSYFRIWKDAVSDLTITVTPFSGDPDLYVRTGEDQPYVNRTNYYWHSTVWNSDSVTILHDEEHACTSCYYYIGVYGYRAGTFLLTATFGSEQQLMTGIPVDGSVGSNGMTLYSYALESARSLGGHVAIDVRARNGLPDIYVKMAGEPKMNSYDYMEHASSSGALKSIDIEEACSKVPPPCIMHIGVHGHTSSNYSIMASLSSSDRNINLINGQSRTASVEKNDYDYYVINVPYSGMDLVVALQVLNGDGDLFMTNKTEYPHPNATTPGVWSSRAAGTDAIALHADETYPGLYYISVFGYSRTRYSITAYAFDEHGASVPVDLQDGVQQMGVQGRGDYRYYGFYLSGSDHQDLTISLTNTLGDGDLFVTDDGNLPNRTYCKWWSSRFGNDSITIRNPQEAQYYIAVLAYSTSVYSLVAVTHESSVELIAGVPFSEDLRQNDWEYFYMTITDDTKDLTITATALIGDPDLYISQEHKHPNRINSTWRAYAYLTDSITIPAAELKLRKLYIGVNAYLNTTFSILASFDDQSQLIDAQPQHAVLDPGASKYYKFRTQATGRDLFISVTSQIGSVAVYAANGHQPIWNNQSTWDWSSYVPGSAQMIIIPANATKACHTPETDPDAFCVYHIVVRAYTSTEYTITAYNGESAIALRDAHPVQATVDMNAYTRFRFMVPDSNSDLAISVTPISGDPDIYVIPQSLDRGEGATHENAIWFSEDYGSDTVLIPSTHPNFTVGEYEISVLGSGGYASFTIVATLTPHGEVTAISLIDGLPIGGRIRVSGQYMYYKFRPTDRRFAVDFALQVRFGDADLYISMSPAIPTSANHTWHSSHLGSDFLTINSNDPLACGNVDEKDVCEYVIAVHSYTPTQFTMAATSTMVSGQLQNGIPVYGEVRQHEYSYYWINVVNFHQPLLYITLTALSGDPDLYVDRHMQHPNTSAEFISRNWGSEEISVTDPERGAYYIGVYAFNNCSFTITASFGEPAQLSVGRPYSDAITIFHSMKHYSIYIETEGEPPKSGLTVVLSTSAGTGTTDLFMNNNGKLAGPDQEGGWKSLGTSATGGRSIYIKSDDEHACWGGGNCVYSLAVRNNINSRVSYTVTYYYGDNVATLETGVPFTAQLAAGESQYFRAMISTYQQDLSISSTQLLGKVSLYAAFNASKPNAQNYTWRADADSPTGTHIGIRSNDPDLQTGVMYVAVSAETDASFTLLLSVSNTMLVSGYPQSSSCGSMWNPSPKYFFLNFQQPNDGHDPADIIFDISNIRDRTGEKSDEPIQIWATNSLAMPGVIHPDDKNHTWAKAMRDGDPLRITPDHPFYCTSQCTFYLSVACVPDLYYGSYQIMSSTADVLEVLPVNTKQRGIVHADQARFYQVYLQSATNFSFTLEPCLGEVDLYGSESYNRPGEGHCDPGMCPETSKRDQGIETYYYWARPGQAIANSIFFGIHRPQLSASNSVVDDSVYDVKTRYVDDYHSSSPLIPDSRLTIGALLNGAIEFKLKPALSRIGTPSEQLTYAAYWSPVSDADAILYTQCGVDLAQYRPDSGHKDFKWKPGDDYVNIRLDGLSNDHAYKFNVFVYDPSELCVTGPSAYSIDQAQPNASAGGGMSKSAKLLMGIFITFGILILIVAIYLWIKNRKLTKELSVEMHDVPAAALRKATRGPRGGAAGEAESERDRAKNFHSLLASEEEDETDTTYIAPRAADSAADQI